MTTTDFQADNRTFQKSLETSGHRGFVGYALNEAVCDHSTLSRTRRLVDLETHREVFAWVLKVLADYDLVSGRTAGVDATTLEANAREGLRPDPAMRSIVRKDIRQNYQDFLTGLARASGIETPTREDLAKLDKTRKNKASNDDCENPFDPDARITKMKDGLTHLAHKAEHAVDMESGAVLAVTLQGADLGDTTTLLETITAATQNLRQVADVPRTTDKIDDNFMAEAVADITMYAQLLNSVSVGRRIACAPFLSCSIRFSWSQRPLAASTSSCAGVWRSLVMWKK